MIEEFTIVGVFLWPGVHVGHFQLPMVIDEDIVRPDISHLTEGRFHVGFRAGKTEHQVPEFLLGEVVPAPHSFLHLGHQQMRVFRIVQLTWKKEVP